jgi:CBS domain-containing protein
MPSVAEFMTTDLCAVAPDTSLDTAARLFSERGIKGAPVVSSNGRALGVVSISDLVDPEKDALKREGYAVFYEIKGGTPVELGPDEPDAIPGRVEDVMTAKVISIDAGTTIEEAGRLMLDHHIHRLLVTRGGELVGIISLMDIVRGLLP